MIEFNAFSKELRNIPTNTEEIHVEFGAYNGDPEHQEIRDLICELGYADYCNWRYSPEMNEPRGKWRREWNDLPDNITDFETAVGMIYLNNLPPSVKKVFIKTCWCEGSCMESEIIAIKCVYSKIKDKLRLPFGCQIYIKTYNDGDEDKLIQL
ncbi:MAG: hypothetical protein P4L35_07845 [Ignavibacteriaceae bacterium]|nr:hypothetical protein [Ignavibacteriaceae bacterium]